MAEQRNGMTTSPHRLIVTGATGNTGMAVIQKLVRQDSTYEIVALVRRSSDTSRLERLGVSIHVCDLDQPETYTDVVTPGSLFLGIANLRFSDRMLPHLISAGISHAFCVTTTAVYSSYHSHVQLYREIEARLLSQPVPVAVLRPSMIYGNERDHNMHKLVNVMRRTPIFPVFGHGKALMQPVFVDDLADGIVKAIDQRVRGPFNLAGPEPITYNDLLAEVASSLKKDVRLIHIDHKLAAAGVRLFQRIPGFPVKHEQVMRLVEDKAFDISDSQEQLGYQPRSFQEGIRKQIARMKTQDR
jgi:nucleoside-diphosphate-sugar epimerase